MTDGKSHILQAIVSKLKVILYLLLFTCIIALLHTEIPKEEQAGAYILQEKLINVD